MTDLFLTPNNAIPITVVPGLSHFQNPLVNVYPGVDAGPYDVVGDGVHDDGPAFNWLAQKARANNTHMKIRGCSGGYYVSLTNGFQIPSGLTVYGSGHDSRLVCSASQFLNVGNGWIRPLESRDADQYNIGLVDVWLDGPGYLASFGTRAIDLGTHVGRPPASTIGALGHLFNLRMEGVTITNWTGPAIYLENPISPRIEGLHIDGCRGGLIVIGESRRGVIADCVIENAHDDGISLSALTNRTSSLLPDELLLWPEDWTITGAHIKTVGNHGIIMWGPRNCYVQAKIYGPGSPDPIDPVDDALPFDAKVVGVNIGSCHVLPIEDVTLDVEVEACNGIGVNIAVGFKYPQETFNFPDGLVLCDGVRAKVRCKDTWRAGIQLGIYHDDIRGDPPTQMRNVVFDGLDLKDCGLLQSDEGFVIWSAQAPNETNKITGLTIRNADITRSGGAGLRFDQNSIVEDCHLENIHVKNPHQFDASGNPASSSESTDGFNFQGRITDFTWKNLSVYNKNDDGSSRSSLVQYAFDLQGGSELKDGVISGLKAIAGQFDQAALNNSADCLNVDFLPDFKLDRSVQAIAAATGLQLTAARYDGNFRYSVSAGTGTVNTIYAGTTPRVFLMRHTGAVTYTKGATRPSKTFTAAASTDTFTSTAHGLVLNDALWFIDIEQAVSQTPISWTVAASTNVFTSVGHGLADGEPIAFSTLGLATGVIVNTVYYVLRLDADTFKVAATAGGSAIDILTDGTGKLIRSTLTGIAGNTLYYARDIATDSFKVAASPGGAALDITQNCSGTLGGGKNLCMDSSVTTGSGDEIIVFWDGLDAHLLPLSVSSSSPTFAGLTISDGGNISIGTGTGTRIGSASSKIGFFGHAAAAKPSAYTPTNVSTDRSYDANATTLDEVADVLGTLIADLQSLGLVG